MVHVLRRVLVVHTYSTVRDHKLEELFEMRVEHYGGNRKAGPGPEMIDGYVK